jgi:hypothetical protein
MSERPKYQAKIEERIINYPFGTAFSASDFLDIADANPVRPCSGLKRMVPFVAS